MSMVKHSNIELSFYQYVNDNLVNYTVNYGETSFETNAFDLWLSIVFEQAGAGAKKFSPVRIDVFSRIINATFQTEGRTAIDALRELLTNVSIPVYDFTPNVPVLIPSETIIIKNSDGRFTVDRIILENSSNEDLRRNIKRSSVFLRVELLTDTVGGHVV